MKLKTGDETLIISGKHRGKLGKIEKIDRANNKAVIAGLNLAKKSVKPSKKAPKGGQVEFPAPIHISNLKYMCPNCNKPTKLTYKTDSKNKKIRICRSCQTDPSTVKKSTDKNNK
ncbi:MAG: 50S ribosomal protein L24 [bacterium]